MSEKQKNEIEERLASLEKRGFQFEKDYSVCPQAVLAAFKEEYGFITDEIFKAATGLAGGIGLTGNTCGALLGGVMVMSTVFGRDYNDLKDNEKKRYVALEMAKELVNRFKEEYGSILCYDIQKKLMGRNFNLWDKEEKRAFIKAGGHSNKCPLVCGKAARWTAEILFKRDLL